jgi:hypothetical protein
MANTYMNIYENILLVVVAGGGDDNVVVVVDDNDVSLTLMRARYRCR